MNPTTNGKELSEYLEAMVGGGLERDIAADFNELPSPDLQHEAMNIYRDNSQMAKLIVKHLLNKASGKVISDAVPQPSTPPPVSPPVQHSTALAEHLSLPKGGKAGQILHKLERFGAWDLLYELENWVSVNVPPYRWVRQGFSLAISMFSVEKVFAALLTLTLLYGGYRLVGWSAHLAWNHFEKGASSQTVKNETGTSNLPFVPAGIPVPQITGASYTEGNKIVLRWNSVGSGYTYRIMRSYGNTAPTAPVIDGQTVNTPGAIVNLYAGSEQVSMLGVIAVSPQGQESDISQPVQFNLKPWNNANSIEPLAIQPTVEAGPPVSAAPPVAAKPKVIKKVQAPKPVVQNVSTNQYVPHNPSQPPTPQNGFLSSFAKKLVGSTDGVVSSIVPIAPLAQGINVTKNAALQASSETNSAIPAPKNLRWDRAGVHAVQLIWDSPGPGLRYNVYVAYAGNHPVFDTGNDAPLDGPEITWTAPTDGTQVFEIYLKAVDAQNHESAESNHIIADLRS